MKKVTSSVLAGTLTAALAATFAQPAGAAMRADAPSQADRPGSSTAHRPDNRPGPLTERQTRLRQAAVEALISGKARVQDQPGGGSVVDLGRAGATDGAGVGSDSVEFFDNDKQAKILSILSQFGDQTVGRYGGSAGPQANDILEPDRSVDNSTTWEPKYDVDYYNELFNGERESMRDFYLKASEGQYDVTNTVEDWVTVPYNGAYYGANPREDEGGAWDFINDTGDTWYAKMIAAGKTPEDIDKYLSQFDRWDRYDYDGDRNYNEPDGYIDHFQAIHAGEGEEAGASPDAIWSHRWYVYGDQYGATGPTVTNDHGQPEDILFGGAQLGKSQYYIGDYTVEPENGGLGVFAHEFGHDLGLPDFYDTAGGENGTAFWTIMSSGSWLGHGAETDEGIGTTPGGFGPDEKLALGWLNHETVYPGDAENNFTLAPAAQEGGVGDGATKAVVVNLPDEPNSQTYTEPAAGQYAWWSGRGDNLSVTLQRSVPAAARVTVTASAWYSIEAGYDFLYAEYSTDGGATWSKVGRPIDGDSRGWENLRFAYRAGGQESLFRFRYQTDGGVNEPGVFLDSIAVTADRAALPVEGAESETTDWTSEPEGWAPSTGTDEQTTARYYLLENRQYVGYDDTLRTGPYQFSEGYSRPNWVEFFSFQPGMLVWYADKSQADNNVAEHPGQGQALPVDARPEAFTYTDGTKPSNRRQPFDATFGLGDVEQLCLHKEVLVGKGKAQHPEQVAACASAMAQKSTFFDNSTTAYYSDTNPQNSTMTAGLDVRAEVVSQDGGNIVVKVTNPAR